MYFLTILFSAGQREHQRLGINRPRLECDRPYCQFQIAVGGGAASTLSEAFSLN